MNTQQISQVYKQLSTCWQNFWQREDGANLVLMAFVVPVLLGFAGLAVDGSNIYYQTQRMQTAADAAALGGARKLAASADHAEVDDEIHQLAYANDADTVAWTYINNNRGVHVIASRAFTAYFARIYGHSVFTVTAEADAQYEPVTGVDGLFPLTLDCDCVDEEEIIPVENSEGGGSGSSPTATATPESDVSPSSGTVQLEDGQSSSYGITYLGQTGNTWSYQVDEIDGRDLSHWLLGINTCLSNVVSYTPGGAEVGTDSSTGVAGIKWNVNEGFTSGTFTFTLDNSYPAGMVNALAKAGTTYGTVSIRGPICDGTNTGTGSIGTSSGSASLCLPTLEFETDTAGAALVAGQVIDTEWAAWGMRVTTNSPSNHPAMIFNTANPTGGDTDLGAPNQSYGGPGIGVGGGPGKPGSNSSPLGKVLVVAESSNSSNPDDAANGGTIVFTFDYPVRIDDVKILDIDNAAAAGTIKAYKDTAGSTLVATGKMQGFGDNSLQTVVVNGRDVRRLEVKFPQSGALASIVSCRSANQTTYRLSNLVWYDTDGDGIQEVGEPGIAGVKLELYLSGQNYVIATATSNAGGEYVFTNLPVANYEVKIAASNFLPGGVLAGATYSPKDATGNGVSVATPTRTPSPTPTNTPTTAPTNTPTKTPSPTPTTVFPTAGTIKLNDNQDSTYGITFLSQTGNTWSYRVEEIKGRDLSHWLLSIDTCLNKIVSYTPSGAEIGTDGSTGVPGIKWNTSDSFTSGTFSFTLNNYYPSGLVNALAKASTGFKTVGVRGPICTTPVVPTATPTTVPTATPTTVPTTVPTATSTPGTNDDTKDSDFDPGTGRAPALITNADNPTVDGGFLLPDTGPQSAIINLNDLMNSQYEVSLVGTSGNTWTYRVRKISGRDLSYWALGVVNCVDNVVSYSPTSTYTNGTDPSTGFVGLKWNVVAGFTDGTFSFTLDGSYQARSKQALIKADTVSAQVAISGPDCDVPSVDTPDDPEEDPGTDGSEDTEGQACSFGWVDWNGGSSPYLELANYMADVELSGVRSLNEVLASGPEVAYDSAVAAQLDAVKSSGETLKIPLTDASTGAICGFANVKLLDYELEEGGSWLNLQFLQTLIHGTTTDPNAPDYGARDVRMKR